MKYLLLVIFVAVVALPFNWLAARLPLWLLGRREWSGTHYDPATRKIITIGQPPAYVLAHESAHRDQHQERTRLFRACVLCAGVPWLRRFVRLALELDADRRAKAMLPPLSGEDLAASRYVIRGYLLTLWIP